MQSYCYYIWHRAGIVWATQTVRMSFALLKCMVFPPFLHTYPSMLDWQEGWAWLAKDPTVVFFFNNGTRWTSLIYYLPIIFLRHAHEQSFTATRKLEWNVIKTWHLQAKLLVVREKKDNFTAIFLRLLEGGSGEDSLAPPTCQRLQQLLQSSLSSFTGCQNPSYLPGLPH